MSYESRIEVDQAYVQAVGHAVYNFAYLERILMWMIAKLNGPWTVPRRATASVIARSFIHAIETTSPALPAAIDHNLRALHGKFTKMKRVRDKLLHAHPFTAPCGMQRLEGSMCDWTVEKVYDAAKSFEEAAIEGCVLLQGSLSKARP